MVSVLKGQGDSAMITNEMMTWFLCRKGQGDSAVITNEMMTLVSL